MLKTGSARRRFSCRSDKATKLGVQTSSYFLEEGEYTYTATEDQHFLEIGKSRHGEIIKAESGRLEPFRSTGAARMPPRGFSLFLDFV